MSPMRAHTVAAVMDLPDRAAGPGAAPLAGQTCDRCTARALVMTVHEHGPLTWCGHHFRRYEPALLAGAGVVIAHDVRDQLTRNDRQGT